MADPKYLRIPMHQGLLESQESSKVPLGFMTELVNWVPEQTGGLRARGKWLKGSEAGLPATRQNRGIGTFNRFSDPVVVQTTGAVSVSTANGSPSTPTFTWAIPTTTGNMILGFIAMSRSNTAGTFTTVVATGWTARNTISGVTPQQQAGLYELLTTQSYSGAMTPFTFSNDGTANIKWTAWLVEVAGIAAIDHLTTATASSTSVTATSIATTQASEMVFAFDAARRVGSATAFTLSTATADWTEYAEAGQTANSDYQEAAIYYGLRRATGTQSITVASSVSVNHVLLLAAYKGWNPTATFETSTRQILAADYTGTAADVYAADRDTLATATFAAVDTGLPSSGGLIAFTMGLGGAFYTGAGFAGVRRYDGVSASTVTGSPAGARCIAISHDRMWAGGTPAYPSRLFYTQLLEPQTWSGTGTGYWDIGTDDGEFIEDITPFNDGLLIGKENSLWFLSGDTTSNFTRSQLPSGGAAPGRSLLTTPFGAVIAGTDMVWLYDGETVTRLGNAIEVSYGIEGYCTSSYQDGSIYIADPTAGRVYAFNLGGPVGTWRVEECEDTIGTLYNVGGRQFMGPYSTTVGSLVNYRDFPAPARGKDYDPLGMSYRMRTGDLWVDGALHPSTPRQMYLQLRQRGGDPADPGLVVTPVFNGVDANDCDVGADTPGTKRVKVQGFPQKHRVGSFGFGITQTLGTGDASVFDIEDAWVEYYQESTL